MLGDMYLAFIGMETLMNIHPTLADRPKYNDPAFHASQRKNFANWDAYLQNPSLCPDCGWTVTDNAIQPCGCF